MIFQRAMSVFSSMSARAFGRPSAHGARTARWPTAHGGRRGRSLPQGRRNDNLHHRVLRHFAVLHRVEGVLHGAHRGRDDQARAQIGALEIRRALQRQMQLRRVAARSGYCRRGARSPHRDGAGPTSCKEGGLGIDGGDHRSRRRSPRHLAGSRPWPCRPRR